MARCQSPPRSVNAASHQAAKGCYSENLFRESRLYPEVTETLDALAAAGLSLVCVTNKREQFARDLLRRAGLAGRLHLVFGGDSFAVKKPDPIQLNEAAKRCGLVSGEAIMVGDSINDREAARRAGFDFVFAAYGYGRADDPALRDGIAVIEHFAALRALLCLPQPAQ
jgi:phosphoglycolate phosphatase